jgi:hypothetical protein
MINGTIKAVRVLTSNARKATEMFFCSPFKMGINFFKAANGLVVPVLSW